MSGYQGKVTIVETATYNLCLDDTAFKTSRGNVLARQLMALLLHRFDYSIGAGLYDFPREFATQPRLTAVIHPNSDEHRMLSFELATAKRLRQTLDVDRDGIIFVQRIKLRREPVPSTYLVRLQLNGTIIAFDDSHAFF